MTANSNPKEKYECPYCKEKFRLKMSLTIHMQKCRDKPNKKFLLIPISLFFLMTLIYAQSIYPGSCYHLEFPNSDPVNVEYISNSSTLEGFSWYQNNSVITYCLSADFNPQEFRIRWFNDGYVPIVKEITIGGGGTNTIEKIVNKTIEVPKYVDREVTKEVEKPVETIKEVPGKTITKTNKMWIIIAVIFGFGIFILVIKLIREKIAYIKIDDDNIIRRLDENGYTGE